jgi:death on curing protein
VNEEPKWVTYDRVVAIHGRQLRRFGGASGLRDNGMLRSALERLVHKWQHERADLATLGRICIRADKNHAFVDGNKRAAFMTMAMMISLAAGEVSERSLARWIGDNWPKR